MMLPKFILFCGTSVHHRYIHGLGPTICYRNYIGIFGREVVFTTRQKDTYVSSTTGIVSLLTSCRVMGNGREQVAVDFR